LSSTTWICRFEEADEGDSVVAVDGLREHLPGRDVERCHQFRGAVTLVLELAAAHAAGSSWAVRMDPLLGLDPGLLIDRQHDRVDWRAQIQAAHVTNPVPELRVVTTIDPPSNPGQIDVHRVQDPPHLRHRDVEPFAT
jgi:hypothetical protein